MCQVRPNTRKDIFNIDLAQNVKKIRCFVKIANLPGIGFAKNIGRIKKKKSVSWEVV